MSYGLKILRANRAGVFSLQITSMIDMFTLILVFLLKSYGTSNVDLAPTKLVTLPMSTATGQPVDALRLLVSTGGVFVDDKLVLSLAEGRVPAGQLDKADDRFIMPLYEELSRQAEKTRGIAKINESVKFEGKLIFQADQKLNYQTVRKVMYTATLAGYSDFKLAVVSY